VILVVPGAYRDANFSLAALFLFLGSSRPDPPLPSGCHHAQVFGHENSKKRAVNDDHNATAAL